jgi:hypothetical protein
MLDGANEIDIIGEFPKSASRSFPRERHNPLIERTKTTNDGNAFILPSLNRPYSSRNPRAAPLSAATETAWRKEPFCP